MSDSTRWSQDKKEFYGRPEIASSYDERRFGGPSGAWVSAREIELALADLPPFRRALDLGCGTGRLTRALAARGEAIGLDSSASMLGQAKEGHPAPLVQGDAFRLPFADGSFDVVIALRLVFHFPQVETLLQEAARIVACGGTVIFDTYRWTPRAALPIDRAHWGGQVFAHTPSQIERAAQRSGLHVVQHRSCFLFSPYLYRRLPLRVVHLLDRLEPYVPERLRARVFWAMKRTDIPWVGSRRLT